MSMKGTADGKYFFEFCRDQKKKCTKNVVVKYNCITNILCQIKSKLFFTFLCCICKNNSSATTIFL